MPRLFGRLAGMLLEKDRRHERENAMAGRKIVGLVAAAVLVVAVEPQT